MKILAIGDPHGELPKNLDKIVEQNKIDVIICVGDIPPVPKGFRGTGKTLFSESFVKKSDKSFRDIIGRLCSYKIPVLTLRGNMYLSGRGNEITRSIFKRYTNLYYKRTGKIKVKGVDFILFDMVFEEDMFKKLSPYKKRQIKLAPARKKRLNKILKDIPDAVLICHNPPYGTLDKIHSGKHVGSKILRKAIEKHQPKLVLCGHIHEAKGEAKIGKTKVINLGCCGEYRVLEI